MAGGPPLSEHRSSTMFADVVDTATVPAEPSKREQAVPVSAASEVDPDPAGPCGPAGPAGPAGPCEPAWPCGPAGPDCSSRPGRAGRPNRPRRSSRACRPALPSRPGWAGWSFGSAPVPGDDTFIASTRRSIPDDSEKAPTRFLTARDDVVAYALRGSSRERCRAGERDEHGKPNSDHACVHASSLR